MNETIFAQARESEQLADEIGPLLAGKPPAVQGAALAEVLSCWLAGHRIPGEPKKQKKMRNIMLAGFTELVREMLPLADEAIDDKREDPVVECAFVFENGMVMAFDRKGEQVPEYQGQLEDVLPKLNRDFPHLPIEGLDQPFRSKE